MTDKEELALFKIKFTEALLEAIPELGLNLYILHHHGFDQKDFHFFPGYLQIGSMLGSVLSIIRNISAKHAYFNCEHTKANPKHPQKDKRIPSIKKIFESAMYNGIPILGMIASILIIMAKNKSVLQVFFIALMFPFLPFCICGLVFLVFLAFLPLIILFVPYKICLLIASNFCIIREHKYMKWADWMSALRKIFEFVYTTAIIIFHFLTKHISPTFNQFLVYMCMLTSILHTIQFSTNFIFFQEIYHSPFNNCKSSEISTKLGNIVDENSFDFMITIWILFGLGFLQIILEYFLGKTRKIEFFEFVFGPFFRDLPKIQYKILEQNLQKNKCVKESASTSIPMAEIYQNSTV